jgi:hypothetical protein
MTMYPLNVVRKSPPSCSLHREKIVNGKIVRPISPCGDISYKSDDGAMWDRVHSGMTKRQKKDL